MITGSSKYMCWRLLFYGEGSDKCSCKLGSMNAKKNVEQGKWGINANDMLSQMVKKMSQTRMC